MMYIDVIVDFALAIRLGVRSRRDWGAFGEVSLS